MTPGIPSKLLSTGMIVWLGLFTIAAPGHIGESHRKMNSSQIGFCDKDCSDRSHHQAPVVCHWATARISTTGIQESGFPNVLLSLVIQSPSVDIAILPGSFVTCPGDPRAPPFAS